MPTTATVEESHYRFEGGPYEGPMHWATAYALQRAGARAVCTNRGASGWHRYVRRSDSVYVWEGPCPDGDHQDIGECGRD